MTLYKKMIKINSLIIIVSNTRIWIGIDIIQVSNLFLFKICYQVSKSYFFIRFQYQVYSINYSSKVL